MFQKLTTAISRALAPQTRVEAETNLRAPGLPDWQSIIATNRALWDSAVRRAETGPRVLLATAIGGHPQFTVVESAIAAALTLRGAKVDILLCDEGMPGCLRAKVSALEPAALERGEITKVFCKHCVSTGQAVFGGLGLELRGIREHLDTADEAEAKRLSQDVSSATAKAFTLEGLPIGEHGLAGALRYFGRGDLADVPEGDGVVRRYMEAAIRTARAARHILSRHRYDAAIINHAIYVPHGILAAVCRQAGVQVAAWNLAYRKQCVIFSHGETYHHTLMSEPTTDWENMAWGPEHEKAIMRYLESRQRGSRDWIWFNNKPDDDVDAFAARVGLDWNKPVVGMLTNVVWDAQLHYPANAFPSMVDWVIQTVAYFGNRPDLQLLIRVHPGELAPPGGQTKSNQPVSEIVRQAFPQIPGNVFIIGPESPVSTYVCAERCNALIIYGTKAGVEFTSTGMPVIVAGEAWIRNKGLTRDVTNRQEYVRILDELPFAGRMDEKTMRKARRYAYHFFFRRMIPLPFLKPVEKAWPPFLVELRKLEELLPGRFPGLDVICDGVLNQKPFVYPAELRGIHDQ